jgi:hypothetical protein
MDLDSSRSAAVTPAPESERAARYLDRLRREENLPAGLVGGLLAALVAAGLWASLTALLGVQFGWLAPGVGAMVGVAVRRYGRGLGSRFGLLSAAFALLGCLLGDLEAAYLLAAQPFGLSGEEVLSLVRFEVMRDLLVSTFGVLDAVFYGVAVVLGYNLSFRRVHPVELAAAAAAGEAVGAQA